jgi:hypothetical protein
LFRNIAHRDQRTAILEALMLIPQEQRTDLIAHLSNRIPDSNQRAVILIALSLIPQECSGVAFTNISTLFNDDFKSFVYNQLILTPPELRFLLFTALEKNRELLHGNILSNLLAADKDLQPKIHKYIQRKFDDIFSDPFEVSALAEQVCNNADLLGIPMHHPLFQIAKARVQTKTLRAVALRLFGRVGGQT